MASPNKQQKRAHRAKAKAKQNRTQRAVATKPDAFAGDDSRIDLESVDLTELFVEMRTAGETSQQTLCAVFLAHRCWHWCWSRKASKKPPTLSSRR